MSGKPITKKAVKRQRVPRTRAGGAFTESQYWSFIRAGLRSKSVRYPVKFQVLQDARRTVTGKRHRYEYQCAECTKWFKQQDVQVDHITPCGSLRSYGDLPLFVERLFCEPEDMQVLCKGCHQQKTNEERKNAKDSTA